MWFQTETCRSGKACVACRANTDSGSAFRASLKRARMVDDSDFACPYGKPWNYRGEWHIRVRAWACRRLVAMRDLAFVWRHRGLGDTIATATHALGIKTCCACNRRRAWLNEVAPYRKAVTHGA
jgi:hypothetical protein